MSKNTRKTKFNRSLFERMIDNGDIPFLLDTQYRMVPHLSYFPSKAFYEDKLKNGREHQIPRSLSKMKYPSWFIDISYGVEECNKKSQQNVEEAKAIYYLIRQLTTVDRALTIGVIAPYKSQIKYLESLV